MMNSWAKESGGAMFQVSMRGLAGLWGVAGGLNAQCLGQLLGFEKEI